MTIAFTSASAMSEREARYTAKMITDHIAYELRLNRHEYDRLYRENYHRLLREPSHRRDYYLSHAYRRAAIDRYLAAHDRGHHAPRHHGKPSHHAAPTHHVKAGYVHIR